MTEPHCSNFRIITAIFQVSQYLGILWFTKTQQSVYQCKHCKVFSCSHRMYVGPSTKFCDGFMSQINNFIMAPFCQHDFFFVNVFQYIYHSSSAKNLYAIATWPQMIETSIHHFIRMSCTLTDKYRCMGAGMLQYPPAWANYFSQIFTRNWVCTHYFGLKSLFSKETPL